MAGVQKCRIPIGKENLLCNRGKGHPGDHKPRIPVKLNAEEIAGTIALVTDTTKIADQRRTRNVETSAVSKLAETIINGAHAAWVKASKPKEWEKTPTITVAVPAAQENALRGRIHETAAKLNRKASIGTPEKLTGGKVRLYIQARDLPKTDKPAAPADGAVTAEPAQPKVSARQTV